MSPFLAKRWRFEPTAPMAVDPSFLFLGDDVLIHIFALLSADDVVALRKSCKYLSCVSQTRYLWHHLLRRDVVGPRKALPWYCKPVEELKSRELELVTRHALRVDSPSVHHVINRFDQARQSISWLRLVHGQWLLVASRNVNTKKNVLTVYSVASVQTGRPIPLFASELVGPVSSGEVEVQADQLVIALCFQVPERMVVVMSVRRHGDALAFHELSRFPGLSHVKCIRGNLVGCAVQGEATNPCTANWKTGEVITLPGYDKDVRCLSMTVRDNVCAVATSDALHMYTLPSSGEATLLQVLHLNHVAESVAISKTTEAIHVDSKGDNAQNSFSLFVTNKLGLYVYRVSQQAPDTFSAEVIAELEEPAASSSSGSSKPSYPCFGGSSSQVSWLYPPTSLFDRQSRLVTAQIQQDSSPTASCAAKFSVAFESKAANLPSLYAMPVMDFDGAGLLAIGNGFGHLALYSFGGVLAPDYAQCLQIIPVPVIV